MTTTSTRKRLKRLPGVTSVSTIVAFLFAGGFDLGRGRAANLPTVVTVEERLVTEVRALIEWAPLAPGLALFEQHYRYHHTGLGWNLDDYWHNPAEYIYTVSIATPHLPGELKSLSRAHLRREMSRMSPAEYVHQGPEGRQREYAPRELDPGWPPAYGQESSPQAYAADWYAWRFNPFNIYACYKYAQLFPADAGPLLEALREKIARAPIVDAMAAGHAHVLNSYIAGYYGYLGLQEIAGIQPDSDVQSWLRECLRARVDMLATDPVALHGSEAGGFMWLVPELGEYLHANAKQEVERAVRVLRLGRSLLVHRGRPGSNAVQ